jgi:hypothetical protein
MMSGSRLRSILVVLIPLVFTYFVFLLSEILADSHVYEHSGIVGLAASVFFGLISLWITLSIAQKQDAQVEELRRLSMSIDQNVLGTLNDFDSVLDALVDLLREASTHEQAKVYFMAYWFWFGADKDFDQNNSTTFRHNPVYVALKKCIASVTETTIVMHEEEASIDRLIQALSEYRGVCLPNDRKRELVAAYMDELAWLKSTCDRSQPKTKFSPRKEIPAIIFAVDFCDNRKAGIWFIGETPMLTKKTQLGGFMSRNPATVSMLINQIKGFS